MTDEATRPFDLDDDVTNLDGLDLELDAKTWEDGGIEAIGPVGFRIDSLRIEKRKTKEGVPFGIATGEFSILARPGQTITNPSKHWDDFSLNARYIDRFKLFAAGCGVKPAKGEGVSIPEVVKALNGKVGYGVIKHKRFTHNGEERVKAEFSKKFGKSFEEVGG